MSDDGWSLIETREQMESALRFLVVGRFPTNEIEKAAFLMSKAVIKHEWEKAVADVAAKKLAAKVTPLNEDFDFAF